MKSKGTCLLSTKQIAQKVNRLAMEIYEHNHLEKEIVLAGIAENGYLFAKDLAATLAKISPIKVCLLKLKVDKDKPIGKVVEIGMSDKDLKGKVVIVADDVLNSGMTLMYGIKPFLSVQLKKLNTVVLVDRSHRRYPVHADFVGLSLSTTLQEHVTVAFGKTGGVFLK